VEKESNKKPQTITLVQKENMRNTRGAPRFIEERENSLGQKKKTPYRGKKGLYKKGDSPLLKRENQKDAPPGQRASAEGIQRSQRWEKNPTGWEGGWGGNPNAIRIAGTIIKKPEKDSA